MFTVIKYAIKYSKRNVVSKNIVAKKNEIFVMKNSSHKKCQYLS